MSDCTKLVKIVCPRCGDSWHVASLKEYLRQVEQMWRPWHKSMTAEQIKTVQEHNDPEKLQDELDQEGYLTAICDKCRLELTILAMYSSQQKHGEVD